MIKVGIVGTRGLSVVDAMKAMPEDVRITAMCDLDEDSLNGARDYIIKSSGNSADLKTFRIYDDMIEKGDIDAVVISTPMQCHVPQAITALQAGKHVMCEVTAAVTMDELWWLIENVEKSGKIYMYAENYCYVPELQLVRALVKKGFFGEIYYGEGEYTHNITDLRNWHGKTGWRSYWQMGTRGAYYPTHSLGPVMQCFDNDRIASIASISPGNHNPFGL
ncbi:MAG: Gfo/Idh/MocA family oxidoreductase, partial [Oscillospiraceae bacterium]|nr:Gfo/Idh/MocA family oxidoreductase [Oscillospiraceae bacterium]